MKNAIIFLLIPLFTAGISGCGKEEVSVSVAPAASYGKAADFELSDINGKTIRLSEYAGKKVIILNFFATWCPPCRMELPHLNELAAEYEDKAKIIAVNVGNESLPRVQKFASDNGLNFTIVMDDGRVSRLYGPIRSIPTTIIINRNFNIVKRYIGLHPKDIFISDLKGLN